MRQLVTKIMEWLVLKIDRDKRDEKQEVYATVGCLSGSIIRQLVTRDMEWLVLKTDRDKRDE
jgi:hypothetical protein